MISNNRWDPYVLIKDESIKGFWKEFLANKNKKTLFILAKGFDPRMNTFIEVIEESLNENTAFSILDIEGDHGPYKDLTSNNWKRLESIFSNNSVNYLVHPLEMWKSNQNSKTRVGPNKVIDLFNDEFLNKYDNIIVDISSMPRVIYFSLITSIMDYSLNRNKKHNDFNFLINVVENAELDNAIISSGVDDKAEFIPRLGGEFMLESDLSDLEGSEKPKIWIPILGEKQENKLFKIHETVTPDEICPVLPFPSVKPRRTDNLILEYREVLFDNWLVQHENLIYAGEANPFELYRHLVKTISRYIEALQPIGGCKLAISSLSSKLLSIGALLTTYELYRIEEESVGLIHVGGREYKIEDNFLNNYSKSAENLITLWVDGEPYEKI